MRRTAPSSASTSPGLVQNWPAPITTEVKLLDNYSTAEAYPQDYFANHPNAGYCAFVVGPKVEKFRKTFARYLKG